MCQVQAIARQIEALQLVHLPDGGRDVFKHVALQIQGPHVQEPAEEAVQAGMR
ncbi:hypothetical protein D3C79_966500 [compost metagenome]